MFVIQVLLSTRNEGVMSAAANHINNENNDGRSAEDASKPHDEDTTERAADSTVKPRRPRGFAAMDPKLVSEIARKGGKAAHTAGTAHEFTSDEARAAGRKGGMATHAKRRGTPEGGGA
jgi:general stress protein YciG